MPRPVKIQPIIGNWYDSKETPECFMIIDSEKNEYIQIQYFDGEIDKLDFEAWAAMHVEEIPEPEDAAAPYEMDNDDILNSINEIESHHDSIEDRLRHMDLDDTDWR